VRKLAIRGLAACAAAVVALVVILFPSTPPYVSVRRLERNWSVPIGGRNGAPARYAVADFAAAPGPDAAGVAALIGEVVRQDLVYEGALDVLPPAPALGMPSPAAPREWQRVGADGLVAATVRVERDSIDVEARIFKVSTGEEAFARGYTGPASQARVMAHTIADEIHAAQAGIRGNARTRLAFVSDRGGLRRELGGAMRRFKEVWMADYDGANERRVTSDGDLDLTPTWSPDGQAIAYTSFRRGYQDIFVSLLDVRRVENPTSGVGKNWLPAWSPDGARIAFTSARDGNEEIYVMNRDGSGLRRVTRHWGIDTSPAWSPNAGQIAFTSNRTGSPQIWVMNADGTNAHAVTTEKYCDRPTWAPAPFNEIAYVSKTRTGFDIKTIDLGSGEQRQLTFGQGFNESPAFSPNGRHIAFSSTRRGGQQVWTISRTGEYLRQVTTIGNNTMPAWSR
jgi:TolB protein